MISILFLALSLTFVNAEALPGTLVQLHRNVDETNMGCLLPFGNFDGAPVGFGDCFGEPGAQAWTVVNGGQFSGAPVPAVATQIKVFGNKCLDNTNGNVANGNKLQIWTCVDGNTNQQWFLNNNLTISLAASGKCVDNTNGNTTFGNQAQLWDCDSANPNQQWEAQSLQAPDPSAFNTRIIPPSSTGSALQAMPSNGALALVGPGMPFSHSTVPNVFWQFPPAALPGQIKAREGPFCLDVTNGVNADGTKLQAWTCVAGSTNQQFQVRGGPVNYTIHWFGTDKCIDFTNGDVNLPVQVWTCNEGNRNQMWQLDTSA